MREMGATPVIPMRAHFVRPNPEVGKPTYRERHPVENPSARLKHYRRFSTRLEKLARNFVASVIIVYMLI